jgi:hypothetical protein
MTVTKVKGMRSHYAGRRANDELATRGQDITAVRPLTFSKVTIPMRGEGIGSTRAFRFSINIEYTETREYW